MNKPIKSGATEVLHNLLLSVPVSRRARLLQCLCFAMLLVSAVAACAASLDVGLGYSSVWVKNDANGVDGNSGYVAVAFDFEFADTWSLGMFIGGGRNLSTGDIQMYPPDSADYTLFFIGLRKSLWSLNDHILTPWIEVGGGITGLDWHTYAYQTRGVGLALGGGVDMRMGPLVLRAQYLHCDCSTTSGYGDAGSLSGNVVSLLFMLWFRIW
jgi:hypothetical protein